MVRQHGLLVIIRAGTLAELRARHKPDLLVIGGISQGDVGDPLGDPPTRGLAGGGGGVMTVHGGP